MAEKVILIVGDGMRPDALTADVHPAIPAFLAQSRVDLAASTVMPSVTLPCHMSMFHSVDPDRHGILSNIYVPQVRPVRGLCETLSAAGKTCSVFYDWEELRDIWRPDSLRRGVYDSAHKVTNEVTTPWLTAQAIEHLQTDAPDFLFLYLSITDFAGHHFGWMSEPYLKAVAAVWDSICAVREAAPAYQMIVTADHGGHDRGHGMDRPDDMTIPVIGNGSAFPAGTMGGANIKDIAPTVASLLGVAPDPEWEGRSLV